MEVVNIKPGGKKPFKRFVKWFCLIILILIVSYVVIIFINPNTREWVSAIIGQKMLQRSVDQYAREIRADKYGGKTPEETYAMFVDALKKEDIELAVKYFTKESKEENKKVLEGIKKDGNWDAMMKDLLLEKNQKGSYISDYGYSIEVRNEQDERATMVEIVLPVDLSGKPISDIWKIESF